MLGPRMLADRVLAGRQSHKLLLLRQQLQQQHCRPMRRRQQAPTVCRHDLRKSSNNVEERRTRQATPGSSAAERALTPQQLQQARATLAHQRALSLCGASNGCLSHQLCLFLLTEQPQLLGVNSDLLAARIASLADVLALSQPDAAELLVRCGAMLDVLPLRLKSAAEALSAALGLDRRQALVMLGADLSLLDTPPLRLRQRLEALSELLQVPFAVLAGMACSCPHLARVDPPAVQIRWANLQALLQLSSADLQTLLQQEPRLLMPSSQTLSQNHTAICAALEISPQDLNRWVLAAPLLLLVPAVQLQKRVGALARILAEQAADHGLPPAPASAINPAAAGIGMMESGAREGQSPPSNNSDVARSLADSSSSSSGDWTCVATDPATFRAYIDKDPRVLLLSPSEVGPRLAVLQQELCCSWRLLLWLVLQHPSYLAAEPGSVGAWLADVRHLCQMTSLQVLRLVRCPQVFLTMSPEEVLLSLYSLSSSSRLQYPTALLLAAQAPQLLQQHPATTSAALQQLQSLLPQQQLAQEVLYAVPEVLLMGQQLQQRLAAAAALLSVSIMQLAVALIKQPSLWWVLVPRHTWPRPGQLQQQQQQQQELSPATALAVESMAALVACKLRTPEVMQQVAVLQPMLLRLGAAAIQQRLQLLQEVCARCGHWQQQLQASLHPEMLGHAILRIMVWHRRMEFLVQSGMADRLQLADVVGMSRADFERYFSFEYSGWKLAGKQQQRMAAAAAAAHTRHAHSAGQDEQQQRQEQQRRLAWLQQQQALQRQQQQQPQAEQQKQQLDQFVDVLQAFASAGQSTAAGKSSSSSSSSSSRVASYAPDPWEDPQPQEQQQQQWQQHGEGDDKVYYLEDDEWHPHGSDNSSSSSSSQDGSPYDSDITQQPQQHDAFKPGWHVRQHSLQVAVADDEDGKQQAHVHTHVPLLFHSDMQLLAVQQSAVELYGSWEGCLVRPSSA